MRNTFLLPALLLVLTGCASSRLTSLDLATADNQTVVQGYGSMAERQYAQNLDRQRQITDRLDILSVELGSTKKGRTKKLLKEITDLNTEQAILQRQAMAYPASIRSATEPNPEATAEQNAAFKQELDRRTQERLNAQNLDKEATQSDDPELDRAYRQYKGYDNAQSNPVIDSKDAYYAVQIGTGGAGKASFFRGVSNVRETPLGNGSSAYCVGTYSSFEQAKQECARIKSDTGYHDAFVVAFLKGKKISVKQALQMER